MSNWWSLELAQGCGFCRPHSHHTWASSSASPVVFKKEKKTTTKKKTSSRFGWPFPATLFTRRCQSSSISVVWGSSAEGRSKTDHLLGKNVGSTQTSLILNVPSAASSLEQMLTEQILPQTNAHCINTTPDKCSLNKYYPGQMLNEQILPRTNAYWKKKKKNVAHGHLLKTELN